MMSTASSGNASSGSSVQNGYGTKQMIDDTYIYDMPLSLRRNLCAILDEQDVWVELAEKMGYSKRDVDQIRLETKNGSPSDELLAIWSDQNHTVTELFILLHRMQQYTAMDCVRNIVDPRYHRLILSGQPDLCALMSNQSLSGRRTTDKQNFKDADKKMIISEKILNGPAMSREDNESKIDSSVYDKSVTKNSCNSSFDMNNQMNNMKECTIPLIAYDELAIATENWKTKNILGRGGFGTVFQGIWIGTNVAVKRIEYNNTDPKKNARIEIEQSFNELRYLNSCRHDNVVSIYGYCIEKSKPPCIVYQLMSGGTLEKRLANTKTPLKVRQRLNIAVGTACGLQYLHNFNKKPLIHGDIKPANILLDQCSHPRIGDFGLAREGSFDSMEVSRVFGTKPYLPFDFLYNHKLSTKVDTYSFGVVLFEIATGLPAYDKYREKKFLTKLIWSSIREKKQAEKDYDDLLDPLLEETTDALEMLRAFIQMGLRCTQEKAEDRPEMVEVWELLKKLRAQLVVEVEE